jgi:hypothetical protein
MVRASAPQARGLFSRLRRAGCASRGPLNASVRWHLRSALPWFTFAALCFAVGYLGCAHYLLRRATGSPLLETLFRPRRSRPGFVWRPIYLLPPAVPPAGVTDNPRVQRLYEGLRANAYGTIASLILIVIALISRVLGL